MDIHLVVKYAVHHSTAVLAPSFIHSSTELQTHLNHYCIKSYFNVSISKPSTLYRTVRNMANIDRPSFIAELSNVLEYSFIEKVNQYCDFCALY